MVKRVKSFIDNWRRRTPNPIRTVRVNGDINYASQFIGEIDLLTYQNRNRMRLGKLSQLGSSRRFQDGTEIRVTSIFGHDIVEVDTSRSIFAMEAMVGNCTITFIDMPLKVPPMRYPGEIHAGEVVGIDYFKTYYTFDIEKCPTCQSVEWQFRFTYVQPYEPRHYDAEIYNHTVYSFAPPAWGEVISQGSDGGGTYIIWKSYTETGDYSRTGLGILLIVASISNLNYTEICNQQQKIDVDCCEKALALRPTEIWWEDFGTCQPFIIYDGTNICKMPTEVPVSGSAGLIAYSTPFYAAKPLYGIPEIKGSCLPIEWTLSGPISFAGGSTKNDNSIYFQISSEAGCSNEVTINLKDRCGTEYEVRGRPCCEDALALGISYYSLLMSCGQSQDLTATGGCPPYSWAIASGGGEFSTDTGNTVTYTAPETNVNCTENPTIRLTDCCGSTTDVKFAVNCYVGGTALGLNEFNLCWCREYTDCNNCGYCHYGVGIWHTYSWDCSGTLTEECHSQESCPPEGTGTGNCGPYTSVTECPLGTAMGDAGLPNQCCGNTNCYSAQCGCGCGGTNCNCGTVTDCRTPAMKAGGCCPINPITGLPY